MKISGRNETALKRKHQNVPHAASVTPATSGPSARERLNCIEFMAMAFGSRSRSSRRSTTMACHAGAEKEMATPTANDAATICQTLIWCV
jgi:hypothetical protein